MPPTPFSLSRFFRENEGFLRNRWEASVHHLAANARRIGSDPMIFGEIGKLLMSLLSLVERKGTAEQAVDAEFKSIVSNLRDLQDRHQLSFTETVLCLFLVRNILRDIPPETLPPEARGEGGEAYSESFEQVSSLLNRLGIVFFEGSMRVKEDGGGGRDPLAIEYALLYERTRQAAITDRLTGLFNFGYFMDRLKEERMRAERYHRLLSIALFDIDHFKKYNDAHGHPAGNEVLKKIASILKEEAREVDIVARYGGEEMVLVLPETSRRRAVDLADRVRRRIEKTHFDKMETQPLGKITISAGVSTYPVDAGNEEELIRKADQSLYRAKSLGRNQVVGSEPLTKVTLRYRPAGAETKVALVGNFNNWDKDVDVMERQADGFFRFDIALSPGVYHYKFVLDDVEWILDPACSENAPDPFGGSNSVLRVKA